MPDSTPDDAEALWAYADSLERWGLTDDAAEARKAYQSKLIQQLVAGGPGDPVRSQPTNKAG